MKQALLNLDFQLTTILMNKTKQKPGWLFFNYSFNFDSCVTVSNHFRREFFVTNATQWVQLGWIVIFNFESWWWFLMNDYKYSWSINSDANFYFFTFFTFFYSSLTDCGASARPLTFKRSAVFRNWGNWSWNNNIIK